MSNENNSKKLYEKIVEGFYQHKGFDLCSDVIVLLDRALDQGALTNNLLNDIADELDKWHFNSSVAKVAGASAGIGGVIAGAGGTAASVGIFLSPVTVGTSALVGMIIGGVVGVIGGVVAVGGTGTVVGTQIANKCHNVNSLKRAQQAIDQYCNYRDKIIEVWKKIENMCHAISVQVKLFGVEAILNYLWHIFLNFQPLKDNWKEIAKQLPNFALKAVTKVPVCIAIAVGVVGTGLFFYNLHELCISASNIHKKKPHPAAVEIRKKVMAELHTEMEKLKTIRDKLQDKCID